ncbi:MAG: universal stress protein [Thermoleophilaceae bacterium]|nr:universal stress protein [Thermoleophilaceae bacterium]
MTNTRPEPGSGERILVVANRTCPCPDLHRRVAERATAGAEVLVVAPALNSRVRHWVSDVDGALEAAQTRLETALGALSGRGLHARGEVGDSDPMHAIGDALSRFDADEIVLSTHPPGRSNWLERDLPERAGELRPPRHACRVEVWGRPDT